MALLEILAWDVQIADRNTVTERSFLEQIEQKPGTTRRGRRHLTQNHGNLDGKKLDYF
jgi:hypothetical protein